MRVNGENLLDLGAIAAGNFAAGKMVDLKTFRWQSPLASKGSDSMFTDWRFIAGLGGTVLNMSGMGGEFVERASFDVAAASLSSLTTTETLRSRIMEGVTVPDGKHAQINSTVDVTQGAPAKSQFAFR